MSLVERIKELENEFIGYRRRIHENPELGFQEFDTTAFVMEKLKSWGIDARPNGDKTGVIGTLRGGKAGEGTKCIALRADMDALPMQEETGLDFASKKPGVCHSCGHDIHTATLLSAARMLSEYKDELKGTVRFIFQPAEETLGGSQSMIENGALDGVDLILGAHSWPEMPGGSIGVRKGAMLAASDGFEVTIRGKGGHAAHPGKGIDPIVIAAYVIAELQTIVSRRMAGTDAAVVSVGHIAAGTVKNIIPGECFFEGTVRTQDPKIRAFIPSCLEQIIKGTARAMGGDAEVRYLFGVPVTMSTDWVVDEVSAAVKELLGEGNLLQVPLASMGGEDFAYYLEKIPGAFIRLGTADERPESRGALHNSKTVFDEKAILAGAAAFTGAVFRLTGSDMQALK